MTVNPNVNNDELARSTEDSMEPSARQYVSRQEW